MRASRALLVLVFAFLVAAWSASRERGPAPDAGASRPASSPREAGGGHGDAVLPPATAAPLTRSLQSVERSGKPLLLVGRPRMAVSALVSRRGREASSNRALVANAHGFSLRC